ncbi:MAG: TonB C-terminal domain-containing protein [Woeseiaceae bacterium]|jgi:periplasmic protein TonB
MANVHVPVDPLDELRLMAPALPDRLPAMLFLAALIHGILIIGVTFNPELSNPFADAISLEVTIVADPDQHIDRPDEAAYLAQASQEGGGNITDQIRPSAPLQSAMPADNQGREDGEALRDARAHEASADEVVATENTSDRKVPVDPRTDPQQQNAVAIAMESGAEATLPLPQEDEASFLLTDDDPRQLIISADTSESVAAAYLDAWKRRIEAVGAAYLPELGNLGKLSGSPTMLVRISRDGELLQARVSRSSGSPLLDLASVDIIQRASPFDEFPAAMAKEYETVAFEYKFLFAEHLVVGN